MYVPKHFAVNDREILYDFMEHYSFGILVSNKDGVPFATHLPFLLDREEGKLLGHMAKSNEHWQYTEGEVMVIFHGPHAYISPTWYETKWTVPTWNYTAVHAYGKFNVIHEEAAVISVFERSVDRYESSMPKPWKADFNEAATKGMLNGIVCFEIEISRLEGKWKLSQNHPEERQQKVIAGLMERGDYQSLEVAKLMQQNNPAKD